MPASADISIVVDFSIFGGELVQLEKTSKAAASKDRRVMEYSCVKLCSVAKGLEKNNLSLFSRLNSVGHTTV